MDEPDIFELYRIIGKKLFDASMALKNQIAELTRELEALEMLWLSGRLEELAEHGYLRKGLVKDLRRAQKYYGLD